MSPLWGDRVSFGECITCHEDLRNGEGLCEGCYDKAVDGIVRPLKDRISALEAAILEALEGYHHGTDLTHLRDALNASSKKPSEPDVVRDANRALFELRKIACNTGPKADWVIDPLIAEIRQAFAPPGPGDGNR